MPFCFSKVPLYFSRPESLSWRSGRKMKKKTAVFYCIMGSIHLQRAYPPNSSHR